MAPYPVLQLAAPRINHWGDKRLSNLLSLATAPPPPPPFSLIAFLVFSSGHFFFFFIAVIRQRFPGRVSSNCQHLRAEQQIMSRSLWSCCGNFFFFFCYVLLLSGT